MLLLCSLRYALYSGLCRLDCYILYSDEITGWATASSGDYVHVFQQVEKGLGPFYQQLVFTNRQKHITEEYSVWKVNDIRER